HCSWWYWDRATRRCPRWCTTGTVWPGHRTGSVSKRITHCGTARRWGTVSAGLTTLEHRLIYDIAQLKGQPVGVIAVLYGVQFDEATGRLYRRDQEDQE